MQVVHRLGEYTPPVKVKKETLADRAYNLAQRLNSNHRRQAIKTFGSLPAKS